uniref:Secreted protein n=1 Tax=Mola mola TaxID=94237 RepID=A0A3Q3WFV3_MOLML
MAPFTVIDLLVQVQIPIQLLLLGTLRSTVAEQQEPAGLRCAKVKGDGACPLGVPLGQGDVRLRGLKGDGVQGRNVLAAEHQVAIQGYFRVTLNSQP